MWNRILHPLLPGTWRPVTASTSPRLDRAVEKSASQATSFWATSARAAWPDVRDRQCVRCAYHITDDARWEAAVLTWRAVAPGGVLLLTDCSRIQAARSHMSHASRSLRAAARRGGLRLRGSTKRTYWLTPRAGSISISHRFPALLLAVDRLVPRFAGTQRTQREYASSHVASRSSAHSRIRRRGLMSVRAKAARNRRIVDRSIQSAACI